MRAQTRCKTCPFIHNADRIAGPKRSIKIRGVPTLRISVSGEPQNLFGNPKVLPGIGSLEKLFGKLQIILEYYIIYLGIESNFVLISRDFSFCLSMVNCKL